MTDAGGGNITARQANQGRSRASKSAVGFEYKYFGAGLVDNYERHSIIVT
jgi:hypothetical protein